MEIARSRDTWLRYPALFILVSAWACTNAQYTATLLQPAGFTSSAAYGVSNGIQIGYGAGTSTGTKNQAVLWTGTAGSFLNLNPTGFTESYGYAVEGTSEVGAGSGTGTGGFNHALLWSGTSSAVDLNPSGFTESFAFGVSGNAQVGQGVAASGHTHALRWTGSAASVVDLNPSGITESFANAISGNSQVGQGLGAATGNNYHALMWTGTAASAVDLNPSGFIYSNASAVSGNSQVGDGYGPATANVDHALLWNGNAASAIDLNPPGFTASAAYGAFAAVQVGFASGPTTGGEIHATVWTGTAASALDLHPFLAGLTFGGNPINLVSSTAQAINGNGDVVGIGYDASGTTYAILWTPVESVSGTVTLQNYLQTSIAGTPVTVEIRSPGSTNPLETRVVTLDASGNFSFTTQLATGTYDITAKASHWLRKKLVNQSLGNFGVNGLAFSLVNGDVNGDNVISLADFGQLRAAFGSTSSSGNWNPNADLNGDGAVSLADFGILRSNFGRQGDP